ncbi:MAG: hypothetical protein HY271_19260 [Deltaproteobacteria bacterium]|nr:hypothetical protein [Deltaproteobacteria bacterium]
MRMLRSGSGLLLATLLLSAAPVAAFDIDYTITNPNDVSKYMTIEKPTAGRDFVEKVASYVRFVPKGDRRLFPVFINTHNYLTCPDSEKKWRVNEVKQVSYDRRRGVVMLVFFFDKPACTTPTFYLEPIVGDA